MDLLLKTIFKTKTMKSRNLNNLNNELSMKQISFTKCFNFNIRNGFGKCFSHLVIIIMTLKNYHLSI